MPTLLKKNLIVICVFVLCGCQTSRTLSKSEHDPGFRISSQAVRENNELLFNFDLFKYDRNAIFLDEHIESNADIRSVIPKNKKTHKPIIGSGYAFYINEPGILEINFYSFSDSLISQIYSGYMDKGIYEILFNHVKIPAGSYLLKLKMTNKELSETIFLPQPKTSGKFNPVERK